MKKIKIRLLYFTESVVIWMISMLFKLYNKYNKRAFVQLITALYWWQIFTGDAARELEADNEI